MRLRPSVELGLLEQAFSCTILVDPADRRRAVFVFADVANELTLKAFHGSEDAYAKQHRDESWKTKFRPG